MKSEFKFKPTFLTKAFWYLIVIGILISLVIFITFNIDIAFRYMFSMLIIFIGLLVVFFTNRNEPEIIEIKDSEVQIIYFNKSFFKRKPASYSIQELNSTLNNNRTIRLTKEGRLIVNVRKESLMTNDWEDLKTLLIIK